MTHKTTIRILIYASLLAMMISQINHTITLFLSITSDKSQFYAYCFALGWDVSIAIFIMKGKNLLAWASAILMLFINLLYYSGNLLNNEAIRLLSASIIISFIMAGIIIAYSSLIHEELDLPAEPTKRAYKMPRSERKIVNLKEKSI